MPLLRLTRKHADYSTDRGYQYEFFCDCCGNGFISEFRRCVMAMAGGAGSAHAHHSASSADRVFLESMEEIKPHFRQCTRCAQWVCVSACWTSEQALCRDCAALRSAG